MCRFRISLSLAAWIALGFAVIPGAGQCLVNNPGGSRANPNRPPRGDVPVSEFSPLAYVNDRLPHWICFSAGYRARFEGYEGGGFRAGSADSYLLTRFRFGVLLKPLSWLRLYSEVQDATAFWKQSPVGPPYQTTWDLRRAHLDLGRAESSPLILRVGRQDLNYGSGRLLGTSYWRNASRGFDAVLVIAQSQRFSVQAFAAAPVMAAANGLSHHQPGNNLHGLYGGLKRLIPGSLIEPFLFWRLTPNLKTEAGNPARLDEKTAGLRWAGKAARFDYDAEVAGQTGNLGTDRIRAWALGVIAGYTLDAPLEPRFFAEYNFASGDRNGNDGTHGTFDLLYPNAHNHHGLADQVGWQNLREVRSGARVKLRRNWTAASVFNDWWLASAKDAFYNSTGGVIARDPSGQAGTHIGWEVDGETSYRVNQNLELGAGVGHIFPGAFLRGTQRNHPYTFPYVMLNYNFN